MCLQPCDQAGEPLAGLNHLDVLTTGGAACFASADAGGAGGSAGASAPTAAPGADDAADVVQQRSRMIVVVGPFGKCVVDAT
jgi:hypothetical protein